MVFFEASGHLYKKKLAKNRQQNIRLFRVKAIGLNRVEKKTFPSPEVIMTIHMILNSDF